tara:strand:+ start:1177 stop:1638 length:462 start_codon:yes stop_codon:yes gene_type:complete
MEDLFLVKHATGAPGLRLLGLGPMLLPQRGIKKLKSFLDRNTTWAKRRRNQEIKKMLSYSAAIVSVWKKNQLIGFGRATSDGIYRAVLWDIVVEKKYQKYGIGKLIVTSILENNVIANVEKIYIMTTNCEIFYLKMGFETERDQTLMMLKTKK